MIKIYLPYFFICLCVYMSCTTTPDSSETSFSKKEYDSTPIILKTTHPESLIGSNSDMNGNTIDPSSTTNKSDNQKKYSATNQLAEIVRMQNNTDTITINGQLYYILEDDIYLPEHKFYKYYQWKEIENFNIEQFMKPKLIIYGDEYGIEKIQNPRNIVFGIVEKSFTPNEYIEVRDSFLSAVKDWENTCNVKFNYKRERDNSLKKFSTPEDFNFIIQKDNSIDGYAKAPFPDEIIENQQLLITDEYFTQNEYSHVGIMRHEIGHILGFLHEHIRREASSRCPKSDFKVGLTLSEYDKYSVMHYLCDMGEGGERTLKITKQDSISSNCIYPLVVNDNCNGKIYQLPEL